MAINLNRVMLVGRLGADPERRGNNPGFVTCRVATSRKWKDRDSGEQREQTEWHSVTLFAEPAANFAMKYLKKGDLVLVEGSLETKSTEKDGVKQNYTSVVVRPYDGNISAHSDGNGKSGGESSGPSNRSEQKPRSQPNYSNDPDDEIPF